ncbi:uncharacterized protein PHALS_04855 [Plasmopara halstedii]|uniref:Uncharacterized protein n=1 Tax=Plasmopara halstedii TaxID=4781 RepID=A0A0N7L400_PLAHL|nr:uncharacterized protein PHALS_04855 [Plasmopara halstedii]CEG37291.1 hypothetical protein PHALS_04855 [Plasmopara halstedii]|eukprot:XP_024573660.1 hypothetical protein PHALS_04855 [Plasmopara halstedii]
MSIVQCYLEVCKVQRVPLDGLRKFSAREIFLARTAKAFDAAQLDGTLNGIRN